MLLELSNNKIYFNLGMPRCILFTYYYSFCKLKIYFSFKR